MTFSFPCRWALIHSFVFPGFPSPVLQKMQDICELSSETNSNLKVCLDLFSRREGVSLRFLQSRLDPPVHHVIQRSTCHSERLQVIVVVCSVPAYRCSVMGLFQ